MSLEPYTINWLVPENNLIAFKKTAAFLKLSCRVVGRPGQKIQGDMSKIRVPEEHLGVKIVAPYKSIYQSQFAEILANAAYQGKLPEGVS